MFDGYSQRDGRVIVSVDGDLFDDQLEKLPSLFEGQLVQALADLPRPRKDSFLQALLISSGHHSSPAIVQFCPCALKPLGDELALEVELGLGDLPRHMEPDGDVLLHFDVPDDSLSLGPLLHQSAVLLRTEGFYAGDDQVGALKHPIHLAPYRFFHLLCPDVGTLPALKTIILHPVATVVPEGRRQVVAVPLAVPKVATRPGSFRAELVTTLAAFQKVLQQVGHFRISLGLRGPLPLQLLRPFPCLLIDQRWNRYLHPGVPRLVADLSPVFGRGPAGFPVDPDARVSSIRQHVMDVRRPPLLLGTR